MPSAPCSSCGTPRPAVASDPMRPDLCATCAGRASGLVAPSSGTVPGASGWPVGPAAGVPGTPFAIGSPPPPVRVRVLDGLLTGLAAGAIGGALWWAVVALTESYYPYLALLIGLLVGQGVLEGTRKGGVVPGLIALVCCAAGLIVGQYFGSRSIVLAAAADQGLELDAPLWESIEVARELLEASVEDNRLLLPFLAIGVLAAVVRAGIPSQRARLG